METKVKYKEEDAKKVTKNTTSKKKHIPSQHIKPKAEAKKGTKPQVKSSYTVKFLENVRYLAKGKEESFSKGQVVSLSSEAYDALKNMCVEFNNKK